MHEILIDTYQQPNPNAHQETTHPPKPTKTELPQADFFTQALIQDAVNLYGGTFDANLHSEISGQLVMAQQANTQATAQPASTASPPMSFMDYVKAVSDSAFIAHFNRLNGALIDTFNRQSVEFVNGAIGLASDFSRALDDTAFIAHVDNFNRDFAATRDGIGPAAINFMVGMWHKSGAIIAPNTSLQGRAENFGSLALDGITLAAPFSGGLRKAGAEIVDVNWQAASAGLKSSAELLKSTGLFGRAIESIDIGKSVGAARRLEYEAAPYHKATDSALKSRAPTNGQDALDVSVGVKSTSSRRIGIDYETGDFVVLDKTHEYIYHGHVRPWKELHHEMQRALQGAGMANQRGRILYGPQYTPTLR
jgi:hypothetical protein